MVNKLQAVCAVMGDNAESNEGGGDDMPGLWDTLPIIVAIGGQVRGRACARVGWRVEHAGGACRARSDPPAHPRPVRRQVLRD